MENPLISIIMPAYFTPLAHVERAIESVINQTYNNIELLFVIDGCDEAYCSQIRSVCERDPRIHVYRIEHGGVSAARNYGIEQAQGAYIMFMDSDDEMRDICVEHALCAAREYGLDIVCGAVEYVYAGSTSTSQLNFTDDSHIMILTGEDTKSLANYFFTYEIMRDLARVRSLPRGPVAKLYSRRIMDVRFNTELTLSEDGVFNAIAARKAERIGLVGEIWYIYHMNSFSASKAQALDKRLENHVSDLREIADKAGFEPEYYRAHIRRFFVDAIEREAAKGVKGRYRRIAEYLHKPFSEEVFSDVDFSRFELSTKRQFNYWLCRKKQTPLIYLFYSLRAASNRVHGRSSQ